MYELYKHITIIVIWTAGITHALSFLTNPTQPPTVTMTSKLSKFARFYWGMFYQKFVCLLRTLHKTIDLNFMNILQEVALDKEVTIKFLKSSESGSRPMNFTTVK